MASKSIWARSGSANRSKMHSADPAMRKQFLDAARQNHLEICSLAMSAFYAQSFGERPTVPQMLGDCIETMKAMGVKVAFLPLGVRGDLVKYPQLRPAIIERLKSIAPAAEKAGVVIGLETASRRSERGQVARRDCVRPRSESTSISKTPCRANGICTRNYVRSARIEFVRFIAPIRMAYYFKITRASTWPKVKRTLDEMNWSGWLVDRTIAQRARFAQRAAEFWRQCEVLEVSFSIELNQQPSF